MYFFCLFVCFFIFYFVFVFWNLYNDKKYFTQQYTKRKGKALDNSLLEEHEHSNRLRENITLYKNKYADVEDLSLKWDLLKMEIRGFTIKYSKINAKKRKIEEVILQHKANKLLQKSAKTPAINNS